MGSAGRGQFRLERGMLLVIALSTFVLVLSALFPTLPQHLVLVPSRALRHFELWRPVSALFAYLSLGAFVFDMIFLWLMGSFIERALGRRDTLIMFAVTGVLGYFAAALAGVALRMDEPLAGAEPTLFAMMLGPAFLYGRQRVLLFGALPARADVISWIFCSIWIAAALLRHDYASVAGDLAAGGAAFVLVRRRSSGGATGLGTNLARARLWWLRRRYKVIQGGKSGREKRWMN